MADSAVVVAASSLNMYSSVPYIVTIHVGVADIELVLDTVHCFYET